MLKVCLVMIVKNEMQVLKRCFDSIAPYLDYWVICDTGSTDGTQDFILAYFKEKNIPGELLQHDWVNFGYNRTITVQAAQNKADYLILIDADFIFVVKNPDFKAKNLSLDSYLIKYEGDLDYRQHLFVSGKKKWKYVGVTHEFITCDPPNNVGILDDFTFNHAADGSNRKNKFERDANLLIDGLKVEPNNSRYMFYLAQSYKDLGKWKDAIKYYEMRTKAGGWVEEIYYSLYQMGKCMIYDGEPYERFKKVLLDAYYYRPSRLESLYTLLLYCRTNGKCEDGYKYGIQAINNKYPSDILFVLKNVHDWLFFDELALCCHYSGKNKEAIKIYKRLIDNNLVKLEGRIANNYRIFKEAYEKQIREGSIEENENEITVILNVYKRPEAFERQLKCVLNQTVKPLEIWVCIFGSEYEDRYISILKNYKEIKVIRSDINFKYYGRYQLALQAKTPYVCFYDDDRFPGPDNLKSYIDLICQDKYKNALLGQWGWILHKPISDETEWEFDPFYKQSKWITPENKDIIKVDYLCGHIFTHKDNLYNLFQEPAIDFSTGEDIRLSFLSYKYNNIESYCCSMNDSSKIIHDEYNIKGSTDQTNLRIRSKMIRKYIQNRYKLVLERNVPIGHEIKIVKEIDAPKVLEVSKGGICFFCPDYTSIGGSELTIKNLYDIIAKEFKDVIITSNLNEMIKYKPSIVITQQAFIKPALENAKQYNYDVYILLHGPGQFSGYHPCCKLVIYNSENLTKFYTTSINSIILQPSISTNVISYTINGEYITFIGSNSYNLIKGSDVFVNLASLMPDRKFLHVSKYVPLNYDKDKYFDMRIPPPVPNLDVKINEINNLEIIEQTKDIKSVYGRTKILIVPSLVESFGRVAVEAAMNSIPVIASDIPGLREATNNMSYYVNNYRDADSFRNAIIEVEKNYKFYQDQTREIVRSYNEKQTYSIKMLKLAIYNDKIKEYLNPDDLTNIKEINSNVTGVPNIGIVLTIYNRPEYLKYTLKSISESDLSDAILILIDDNSSPETVNIIKNFNLPMPMIKIFKNKNLNMFHSLNIGWRILQRMGCKYLCNIDSDVLVKPNWLNTLKILCNDKNVVTGFNTINNNHIIISEAHNYYEKLTVGGINLFFHNSYYSIFEKILVDRMWDYNLSYKCKDLSIRLICTKPSVIQHIGYNGLNANPKNFDYAYDFYLETKFDDQEYYYYPGLDSPGNDIRQLKNTSVKELSKECNEDKNAVAFNSAGWIKSFVISDKMKWVVYDILKFTGIWVKK